LAAPAQKNREESKRVTERTGKNPKQGKRKRSAWYLTIDDGLKASSRIVASTCSEGGFESSGR
jgi:hypothetical protein